MEKYLLTSEKEKINHLIELLSYTLATSKEELQVLHQKFNTLIKETKDYSIQDILNTYFNLLASDMHSLLEAKITPAIQFGIQNNYFSIIGYGGLYNNTSNSKEIQEDTLFSFDSISKLLTSTIMMQETRKQKITLDSSVSDYNPEFALNSSIESILKFTARIKTEKRIDQLSKEETISILKRCKEDLELKSQYKNFYEYNDIGYMIMRLSLENFLEKANDILTLIDNKNLTIDWKKHSNHITGGKITEEYITPDLKGRDILFPGHTGLYGNIIGLLQLFYKILYTEEILTTKEKERLFSQPYLNPIVYTKDGTQLLGKNGSPQYMAKVSGIYRKPTGINDPNYNKMASCDMSHLTTDFAKASTGTCGSWVMGDDLSYQNKFGTYTCGLLTNPYSMVEPGTYPNPTNQIPNSNLIINQKGIILGYHSKLNYYKERMTEYSLLLELLIEYLKEIDSNALSKQKYQLVKKLS